MEILVIVDMSGSMSAMGKSGIVGNILCTLSAVERMEEGICVVKKQWQDGDCRTLERLCEGRDGQHLLLLTDGYALQDNCRESRIIKGIFERNNSTSLVVLCGGDALDISKIGCFSRFNCYKAENILCALEQLMTHKADIEEDWA